MIQWEKVQETMYQCKIANKTIYVSTWVDGDEWYVSCLGIADDLWLETADSLESAQEEALDVIFDECCGQVQNHKIDISERIDLMVALIRDR